MHREARTRQGAAIFDRRGAARERARERPRPGSREIDEVAIDVRVLLKGFSGLYYQIVAQFGSSIDRFEAWRSTNHVTTTGLGVDEVS